MLVSRHTLLALVVLFSSSHCRRTPAKPTSGAKPQPARVAPKVAITWDPATGRGDVVHHYGSGDMLRTCFHCKYAGYTGGLVIGNFNGSGMEFRPRIPIRGFASINVFCAQDESIWDRDENAEYTYGWSENFGRGDDGKRLLYQRGRIIERGPERVLLESENGAGCYGVTKLAFTRAEARWWIIATRITNRCAHSVHFDFFTGDDPWLGLYQTSDGDVGWTTAGIVERESDVTPFFAGGLYDLGSKALGQTDEKFSNQADFFALDPAQPLPDRAFVANRFAHTEKEITPGRPLDNKTMIALNLGWTNRTLQPGEGMTVAVGLGMAETGTPGSVPGLPEISVDDWSVWRHFLIEGSRAISADRIEFASEDVTLTIERKVMGVEATYYLHNTGSGATSAVISYPILVADDRLAPSWVAVDGRRLATKASTSMASAVEVDFPLTIPGRSLASFHVAYTQPHRGRQAVYLVTSARRWPTPITRAVFRVHHAASLGPVHLSYPVAQSLRVGEEMVDTIVEHDFRPEREVEVRW